MGLVIVLNEEEAKALDEILSSLEEAWRPCLSGMPTETAIRLVRDRLDAAIADKAMDEASKEQYEASKRQP